LFFCGLPTCLPHTSSSWAVAWLERWITGFFVISSHGKHMWEGDHICNTFFVQLQICSWTTGVKVFCSS
jgi:hypothetical protein